MTRKYPSLLAICLLILGFGGPCFGNSDAELKEIREIAISLLKQKNFGTPSTYCELTTMRPTNPCSGKDRLEDRLVAHQSGALEWIRFRSWAEAPDPKPGEYRGRLSPNDWKALLTVLSKMEWIRPRLQMPPPGPSETYSILTLSDGTRKGSYSIAGTGPIGQTLISDGFDQMSNLGQNATDTLWTLALVAQKGVLKSGSVNVEPNWVATGKTPIEVSVRANSVDSSCGTATLAWYYHKPETPGITPLPVEFEYVPAAARSIPESSWIKVDALASTPLHYHFQLPGKLRKDKKAGKLIQLGVLVRTAGLATPVNVALFSNSFPIQ